MKPKEGEYYEILTDKRDGHRYHVFNVGDLVKCIVSGVPRSAFTKEGAPSSQTIYNEDVIHVDKNLISIWRSNGQT